jgi:copper resistance protein D
MEAAMMGNGLPDAVNLDTLSAVLFETSFGHVWVWHLLAAALLLGVLSILRGSIRNLAANALIGGIAIALVVTLAWTGHAVMRSGSAGVTDLAAQMIHLLAGSAWLGSFPALGYILYRSQGEHAGAWRAAAHYILPRYSRAGYFAVGLILLTGCLNSWRLVGNVDGLIGTATAAF